jgi:recombination protein RecR
VHVPEPLARLIQSFSRLPGIGPKTAMRLAFFVLRMKQEDVHDFAKALVHVKRDVRPCTQCGHMTDKEQCIVCTDGKRDQSVICVVQEAKDVLAMERTREYNGLYHVLHGAISPLEGIGPDQLNIPQLLRRVAEDVVQEVILATNPNVEGEATASYLARMLQPFSVAVSRIAHGLPVGGDLEYADEATLMRALEGRRAWGERR